MSSTTTHLEDLFDTPYLLITIHSHVIPRRKSQESKPRGYWYGWYAELWKNARRRPLPIIGRKTTGVYRWADDVSIKHWGKLRLSTIIYSHNSTIPVSEKRSLSLQIMNYHSDLSRIQFGFKNLRHYAVPRTMQSHDSPRTQVITTS